MSRLVALSLVALVALAVASSAAGTVKRISLTTPVVAGSYASLTVNVTPRARCSIQVIYDTVVSSAKGLGRKTGGRITWRWRVGTSTHPGRWPIIVDCGKSGKLRTRIRVLPR
jgi:micrococcal nuclease